MYAETVRPITKLLNPLYAWVKPSLFCGLTASSVCGCTPIVADAVISEGDVYVCVDTSVEDRCHKPTGVIPVSESNEVLE